MNFFIVFVTILKEKINWVTKVNRFLYFCLNGGLCDYAFNFRDISTELSKYIETHTSLIKIMNMINLDKLSKGSFKNDVLITNFSNFDVNLNCYYNEDTVCGMIKTGLIFKLFSDNSDISINILKLVLKDKNASNKILGKIFKINNVFMYKDNIRLIIYF